MASQKAELLREMAEMYRHAARVPGCNCLAYRILLGMAFDLDDETAKLENLARQAIEKE